jgi:DNA-binding winged helix-turn-helix (wHTH) protein/WD40 repeat protein
MDVNQEASFVLGEIQVSPSHNTLGARGKSLKLQPKVMAVLHYLARHHGRVISNEELIREVWEGRIVTHGSVQKSINALRSALVELIGEQEVIAHYSKRGYQLKLEPEFLVPDAGISAASPSLAHNKPLAIPAEWQWPRRFKWAALAGLLVIGSLLVYSALPHIPVTKVHKTVFHSVQGFTNETGHERNAVPHPDNEHVAYIREKFNNNNQGETDSEIVIRDRSGKDWRVASSHGSWFKMAWSPTGQHLAAIEVRRSEGLPFSPNFYEKPNYLYSFHIFSLDLANNRLVEKQLLSQWQGRIFSVTWWDDSTLEFVAKQGPNARNARYRYSIEDQRLSVLDEVDGVSNPLASAVLNKKTALASLHKNAIQIDFLNENQSRISRWQLKGAVADISWIPDGSGILVYAEDERKLFTLYLNGEQTQIPLTDVKDRVFSRPRFRPDGEAIFYTEEKRSSNILMQGLDGKKSKVTDNADFNYSASFSPDGERVVYASVRNNQIHLWLVEAGEERQLTNQPIPKRVGVIAWSPDGEHLLFSAGSNLYAYTFQTAETNLLLSETERIEPIAYYPDNQRVLVIKSNGEIRNLWRINTQNQQQKQLTFGSVGSAIEHRGDIYFQYVGESGLWVLRHKDDSLEQIAPRFENNSKLLKVDNTGVYFIRGGMCRESDLYYFDFAKTEATTVLKRDNNIVSTTSFSPERGLLQTDCYLAEANIVLLK